MTKNEQEKMYSEQTKLLIDDYVLLVDEKKQLLLVPSPMQIKRSREGSSCPTLLINHAKGNKVNVKFYIDEDNKAWV